ncbi:hypothetical protein [Melittangium boletus]|uniref:hypothetical protein n=1 Tax=Melittangium boletus TaxID=83453 RepID=UPI003DA4C849
MRGWWGAWAVGAMVVSGCGGMDGSPPTGSDDAAVSTDPSTDHQPPVQVTPAPETPVEPPPTNTPPAPPRSEPPPTPPEASVGPWPDEPVVHYSARYGLGTGMQGVAVDDAYNIWMLDGDRIGVLRPGDSAPRWVSGVGQASQGFGSDKLALGSSVICGGSAGRVYVGYLAAELDNAFIYSPDGRDFPAYDNPDSTRFDAVRYQEYQKGDLDAVKLTADGNIVLEEHLSRSARSNGPQDVGIRNTNDHHFDEDRSVFSCTKVMRGEHKGQIYIGTNHGVTRIQGLVYNSHRHPVWFKPKPPPSTGTTQMAGYTYALGIAQNGDVLIGNDWQLGVVTPSPKLADWDRVDTALNQDRLNSYLPELNSQEDKDLWRGVQQTTDGKYYAASRDFGLWNYEILRPSTARGTKVSGVPTDKLTSLAATDDGSLFIGTTGFGLWRLDARKQLTHVEGVEGVAIKQLVYDPTVKPAMLYVLTDRGLTVLRGH